MLRRLSQVYLSNHFNPFTLRVSLESIVCYFHTSVNNTGIKQKLSKYLKESSRLTSG